MKRSVVICADATPHMGAGHVMRCLALADALQETGFKVRLAANIQIPWLRFCVSERQGEDFFWHDIPADLVQTDAAAVLHQRLSGIPADWVVFDGYHFDACCQRAAKKAGSQVLVIDDDNHLPAYVCDVLVNPAPNAPELAYQGSVGALLTGPRYALLRPQFAKKRRATAQRPLSEGAQRILLNLGGGDFSHFLENIAPLFSLPEWHGRVLHVLTGAMPERRIHEALKKCPAVIETGRGEDMASLLAETDFAISAAGGTCWELCCMGVPFLTLEVAPNQRRIRAWLARHDVAPFFARAAADMMLNNGERRHAYARRVRQLTDGQGARLLATMMARS